MPVTIPFERSAHCTSRKWCKICRSDAKWRAQLGAPDKCPFGVVTGVGDVVEMIAQPIARVIDRVAGTNVQECGGCSKRRDALNRLNK
jgi:hypothetical protein